MHLSKCGIAFPRFWLTLFEAHLYRALCQIHHWKINFSSVNRSTLQAELTAALGKLDQEQTSKRAIEAQLNSVEKDRIDLEIEVDELKQVRSIYEELRQEIMFVSSVPAHVTGFCQKSPIFVVAQFLFYL